MGINLIIALRSLSEIASYIKTNQHLPEVPSAAEVEKNRINVGETNTILLKKIEELTLYLIEKDNKDKAKDVKLQSQQSQIDQLKQLLETLKEIRKTKILKPITMKSFLTLLAMLIAVNLSYAQTNTFPSSGNVGIGTTSPAFKLDVQGGNASIYNSASATAFSIGSANTGKTQIVLETSADANGYGFIQSIAVGGSTWGNTIINQYGGNVGIGTTSPGARLEVNGTSRLGGGIDYGNTNVISVAPGTIGFDAPGDPGGRFYISGSNGNVGIGTTSPDTKLAVNGTIHSKEVKVDMNVLPDYVFKPTYNLASLQEVKAFIDQNHHLPEVPSAKQVAKDGLNLGEMNGILLKKVEELTLYLIDKDKQAVDLNRQVTKQDEKLIAQQQVYESLQEQINELVKKLKNK